MRSIIDEITFFPPHNKQILVNWINSVTQDWPISRRRFYGTEIPLWYCKKCNETIVPSPGPYYQPWKDPPPEKKCPSCGTTKGFEGETRTMDTWMDSSISPLITIFYTKDDELFHKLFPASIRPQGKDIVRTWLYYSVLRIYQLFEAPAFRYAWISGMGLDENGEKMSKSRGNIVDPNPLLEKYGADAIRLWGALEASLGSDFRFSEDRVAGTYRFLTKLWNISRFISGFPQPEDPRDALQPADHWILSELNQIITQAKKGYDQLDFIIPARELRTFTWDTFASHYLELVKGRAYGKEDTPARTAAWYTLHTVLQSILKFLAPICPYITEKIHRELYDSTKSIHKHLFPEHIEGITEAHPTELLTRFNATIWKHKKDHKMSLRATLPIVTAPKRLKPYAEDLKQMHNIEQLSFHSKDNTQISPPK